MPSERLGKATNITYTHRPGNTADEKVFGTKVEEGNFIVQGGLHIGDERQDMRNRDYIGTGGIDATAINTAGALDNPQVLAQVSAIEMNAKLLGPEEI